MDPLDKYLGNQSLQEWLIGEPPMPVNGSPSLCRGAGQRNAVGLSLGGRRMQLLCALDLGIRFSKHGCERLRRRGVEMAGSFSFADGCGTNRRGAAYNKDGLTVGPRETGATRNRRRRKYECAPWLVSAIALSLSSAFTRSRRRRCVRTGSASRLQMTTYLPWS